VLQEMVDHCGKQPGAGLARWTLVHEGLR
jgi:hypothetical protein